MEPRFSMITLGVADLEKSAAFYEKIFSKKRSKNSNDGIVFVRLSGIVLALFSRKALAKEAQVEPCGSGFRCFALSYHARSESEVDEFVRSAEEAGGTTVKKPQKGMWGLYNSYFSDPDGNIIEIAYNPIFPILENGEIDI